MAAGLALGLALGAVGQASRFCVRGAIDGIEAASSPTLDPLKDAFIAELDESTWTAGSKEDPRILSPKNFAVDPDNAQVWRMSPRRLDAEQNVFHDGQLRRQRQLLVNHRDAALARVERAPRAIGPAIELHDAFIGLTGDNPDQDQSVKAAEAAR